MRVADEIDQRLHRLGGIKGVPVDVRVTWQHSAAFAHATVDRRARETFLVCLPAMRLAAIAIACAACGGRLPIAPPSPIPLDDVVVRLDQRVAPPDPSWLLKPRWQHIRDYDIYEPTTANDATPLAILIHDAGGHRRELGPLARHLAKYGVRAVVPAIDYDDPSAYWVLDTISLHRRAIQPEALGDRRPPTVYVGHGAGGYVAAQLSVQSNNRVIGGIAIAPATPPGVDAKSIGYAGDDHTRTVQLDVAHPTGHCIADASDISFRMIRNYRTRAVLAGTSYCSVLGEARCAARCGGTQATASAAAFEAVARVVTAWTKNGTASERDLLAATPTIKGISQKPGDVGSEEWAMPGLFGELGGAAREGSVHGAHLALGIRLDYHPVPNSDSPRVPKFARQYRVQRWGVGGYGEAAWQHDDLDNDDLRLAAGFALARATGKSHFALGLGANVLFGEHGITVGADATVHMTPFFAVRAGWTLDDPRAVHATFMVTVPPTVLAILIPLLM